MGKVLEVTGEPIPPGGCSVGLGVALGVGPAPRVRRVGTAGEGIFSGQVQ